MPKRLVVQEEREATVTEVLEQLRTDINAALDAAVARLEALKAALG